MRTAILLSLLVVSSTNLAAQTVTTQYTARLTDSGDAPQPLMPVITDAVEPEAGITPALHIPVPNAQAPRLLNLVNPAVAIPYNSTIRQVEAYWNGTALPMIDPFGTLLVEEAHSYGPMFPFFKPLFSVAAVPAGPGTLEIRAFDSSHTLVTSRGMETVASRREARRPSLRAPPAELAPAARAFARCARSPDSACARRPSAGAGGLSGRARRARQAIQATGSLRSRP